MSLGQESIRTIVAIVVGAAVGILSGPSFLAAIQGGGHIDRTTGIIVPERDAAFAGGGASRRVLYKTDDGSRVVDASVDDFSAIPNMIRNFTTGATGPIIVQYCAEVFHASQSVFLAAQLDGSDMEGSNTGSAPAFFINGGEPNTTKCSIWTANDVPAGSHSVVIVADVQGSTNVTFDENVLIVNVP